MRICIVTPSEEFSASAGVRIRYDRIALAIKELGHDMVLRPVATFQSRADFHHDAYIFAKTYTPVSQYLARRMRQIGRPVGIDVFDDYFTQTADTRLLRYRLWFAGMAELADFFLCSTEALAEAIQPLINGKPLGIIADPSEVIDQQLLDHVTFRKEAEVAAGAPLRIVWFGIGDNPYFPVGLRDLSGFGGLLEGFRPSGARLHILTNVRALGATGLAMLRRLPLAFTVEEWTAQRERAELMASHVCFMPVNSQPFSKVKSLNRAITALSAGCQVLSAGFPLYDGIGAFVYRSADALRSDLAAGKPLLGQRTVGAFAALMTGKANPFHGAGTMLRAIATVPRAAPAVGEDAARFATDAAVLHGSLADAKLHKLVQRLDGFTVKGPTCRENWNCHLRLDVSDGGRLRVFVADAMAEHLAPACRAACKPFGRIKEWDFAELDLDAAGLGEMTRGWTLADAPTTIKLYAVAPHLPGRALALCRALFPGLSFDLNERLAAIAPLRTAS